MFQSTKKTTTLSIQTEEFKQLFEEFLEERVTSITEKVGKELAENFGDRMFDIAQSSIRNQFADLRTDLAYQVKRAVEEELNRRTWWSWVRSWWNG